MKKRIFYTIIFLSVITVVVTGICSSLIYYKLYLQESKEQLKTIVEIVSDDNESFSDYASIQKNVNNIKASVNYNLRITIIESDGEVYYDSYVNAESLENHRNRPEILEAFNTGVGEDTRYSTTYKSDAYYYAVKLSNENVLRLSRQLDDIKTIFVNIVPLLTVVLFILIAICFFIASNISKNIIKPIQQMSDSLDSIVDQNHKNVEIDFYDELEPLAYTIREQKIKINDYIIKLEHERDTISRIIENMKEGFILLNKEKNILSINTSAKHMVGNGKFDLSEHKHILQLTRNSEIIDAINSSFKENKHMVHDVNYNSHHYRYFLSPVSEENDEKVDGLLIFIEDVTMEKNAEIIRHEFSANVSHELKTPLTIMNGFAEMIKEGLITDSESIKKYCGMINKEGLRLISLIEDIIRLSKIEERVDSENSEKVNLKYLSNEICELLQIKAEDRNVQLSLNSQNIVMLSNKNYMNELLYNLVDNAIKYNKEGGKVDISITKNNKNIIISVKDNGVGIPKQHQSRIFERFYRVDKSRSKETGGTGLGLSIVKHIVELYDGTIDLKSIENIGTEITIKFPIKYETA